MKKPLFIAAFLAAGFSAQAANLQVWTHFSDSSEVAALKSIATAFSNTPAGKGHTVTLVAVPISEIFDKVLRAKAEGPDLVMTVPHDRVAELAIGGAITPMDNYFPATMRVDTNRAGLDTFTYQGKLFGIPMFGEAVAAVYNKKLLPNGMPKTWDEFTKAAQTINKPSEQKFMFAMELGNQYMSSGFLHAFGGYVFGRKNGQLDPNNIGLNNAGAVKAYKFINDLRYRYNYVPEGIDQYDPAKALFTAGNLAIWYTGPWALGDVKKSGIDFGIGQMPKPPGANKDWSPFVGVQGIVMSSYSKNKEVAAAFARFVASAENQVALNKAGGRVPMSLKASRTLANDPVVAGFSAAIAKGTPMPNIPEMPKVWGPWDNAVKIIVKTPNASEDAIKKALDTAVNEIKKAITGK